MNPLVLTVSLPEMNFLCRLGPADATAPGPSAEIPELEILDHYAGVWEDQILTPSYLNRTVVGDWILDGTFLRQSWITETPEGLRKATGINVMTFDVATRVSWSFLAIASVVHSRGQWDQSSQTMTWVDPLNAEGEVVITTTTFTGGVSSV